MRILQLGKAYPPANLGGVEVVIKLLTEGLNDHNIKCDALGVNDKCKFEVEDYRQGKIFRSRLIFKKFSTLFSFQLIRVLFKIQHNYDIIHIHSPDPMAAIALWLVKPKCKIVLHWHSDIIRQKKLLYFFEPFLSWLLKRSDVIFATSPNYINGSKHLQKHAKKCVVLPIGINLEKGRIVEKVERFNRFTGKKIIFSLGRLAYYKGFKYLILAGKFLKENEIIIIAGCGEEMTQLQQLINSENLEKSVFLVGKVTEVEKFWLYEHATAFVLSSIYKTEAYGIVQVEALAFGLPIVSTRIAGSGVDFVNKHNVSGLTVNIADSFEIGQALRQIIDNAKSYQAYSVNARNRYLEYFTQDKMILSVIQQYKLLLSDSTF